MTEGIFVKRAITVTALAVLVGAALVPSACVSRRPHPSELKYPPLEIVTPEVVELSLPGGMEGFMIEDREIPVVDLVILFRTYFPSEDKLGLNEMARWVMRNGGSSGWPADSLNDELEFLAASVEISGGNLSTTVAVNCLKKDLDRVLEIAADLIRNPLFSEERIEQKRGDMLEAIRRQNDQPQSIARREFNKLLYHGHPYGGEQTVATVSAITRDDLVDFHRRYFRPNNAIVGVSGDVTADEIRAKLSEALAGWEPLEAVIPEVPPLDGDISPSWNYVHQDISQVHMRIGHLGINSNNEDRCAVNILNFILGGGAFTSWIGNEVRERRGLAYSAGSFYTSDAFARGMFAAYAQTKAEEYGRAMQVILDQIEKMKTVGPTEAELRSAVDSFLNSQVFDYDSKSGMVRRMVTLRFEARPLDTPERDMEAYARLTVDDIRRAAEVYLHPDRLTVLIVGDAERFDRPLSDFGTVNVIELGED